MSFIEATIVSRVFLYRSDIIHAPFEPTANNKRKTSENDLLQDINGPVLQVPTLTITNPTTQESYQVYTEKYSRAKNAAETELLTGEKGFNHLLSFLFGAIFSNEELRESSINGTVKGTKPLCPQRVHTIDQHMYNIYGQRSKMVKGYSTAIDTAEKRSESKDDSDTEQPVNTNDDDVEKDKKHKKNLQE
ncbi:unnamed protein product [Didymodactylos carnosus]|uniref:Uncharacterized protein n=1 Tax=Didymodactylos carnosus TaxID=1234261 RepID=A0A8S2NQY0_9BILA|nr:unnamed protein product [Didymodactylos carnosus]CAF4012689.1 unnamed protein product [Didymodactylos carnosus]